MVVLEGGGVVTIGNNQYLQPDYLSPLSTTMDSKKSPLALLAQTCSQIGADSNSVKPTLNLEKKKTGSSNDSISSTSSSSSSTASKSPSQVKTPKTSTSQASTEIKVAFKPYEANVLNHQHLTKSDDTRPNSKSPNGNDINSRVPSRSKSSSSSEVAAVKTSEEHSSGTGKISPISENRKTVSPAGSSQRGASPIVRSGMEVLHGHPSPYKTSSGPYAPLNSLTAALCCPPGMEQHANPAFRPPFGGGYTTHQHAAMLAAAAANGYGGAQGSPNPYITYQRIKTPSGGEAIVPICKDPYCPGCPYTQHAQQMLMGTPCPSGCTQCEHQKYGLAMAASMAGSLPPSHPYAAAAAVAAVSAAQMRSSPYVCSWIVNDSYCGKRFNTSDELFTHLRTHTGNLSDPAAAAAALAQSQAQTLLTSLFPPSALQRGYPTPPLSPMSAAAAAAAAARYHPYAKPGSLPSPLSGPAFANGSGFNPAAAAALGPYYSPYALYGQRIGSAAVHQ